MTVEPGTRLGPYKIVAPLGSGGMGEVYRATDTRLDRTVAIKIMSPDVAHTAELRQRFEREAQATSSLNHPHICTLFDVGQQNGLEYLVMEYLDGETLAARLIKGPLPIDQVLRYANEIVSALDAAHRQGITHRDLKPANIMLTRTGAKLLDFGLAKWNAPRTVIGTAGMGTTQRAPLTTEGTLIGTFNYMAPEQLEGKEADARSDLFAFGAVVYEMATGRRAFDGATQASVIAAILHREPEPLSRFQPLAPITLERLVQRCLHKDPENRWQTARDLSAELTWLSDDRGIVSGRDGTRLPTMPWRGRQWQGAALLVLSVAMAAVGWRLASSRSPEIRSVVQSTIPLSDALDVAVQQPAIAVSPDGKRVVYRPRNSGPLYLRTLDQRDDAPVPGTDGGVSPFFSPDGQWLGFFVGSYLKKVSLVGAANVTLAEFPSALDNRGASWSADDTIVYAPSPFGGFSRVSSHGGRIQTASTLDVAKGEANHRWPEWLPAGQAVIFTIKTEDLVSFDDAQTVVRSLVTGAQHVLFQGAFARYVPTGHLVFGRSGSLQAVPFDVRRLEVTGAPVTVLDGVVTHPQSGAAQFAIAKSGTLVYAPGNARTADRTLVWADRRGTVSPLLDRREQFIAPRISPDGRRLAVTIGGASDRVWISDLERRTLTPLTAGGNRNVLIWTPDSSRITVGASKPQEEFFDLYSEPADGSGIPARLVKIDAPTAMAPTSWSPDGRTLLYQRMDPKTGWDLWIVTTEAAPRARPLLQTPFNEWGATFSPNGRWMAYSSNESGRGEVYVRPFPGPGGKSQISTDGGANPVWAANGRELFFSNGNKLLAVPVATEGTGTFGAGRASLLFSGAYDFGIDYRNYDVAPDGQRFVVIENGPDNAPTHLNLVQNWLEELKRLVPPRG